MSFSIVPSGAALGAEIAGVDLTRSIDVDTFAQIRSAFFRYEVIYFRGRELSDADHIRFSARFGRLRKLKPAKIMPRTTFHDEQHPEVSIVSNILKDGKLIGSNDAGMFWHTDGNCLPNPYLASLLHAIEVPEQDGRVLGDTLFASVSTAYDALPDTMKKRLVGLEAVNSLVKRHEKVLQSGQQTRKDMRALRNAEKHETESVHPVVRVHPVTGRKCLYVSDGFTVRILGLPEDESRDLLAELTAHCVKPEFQYRHNWRAHDLVMWDDCSTQHKATFDYALPQRRLMHRTTVINELVA